MGIFSWWKPEPSIYVFQIPTRRRNDDDLIACLDRLLGKSAYDIKVCIVISASRYSYLLYIYVSSRWLADFIGLKRQPV